MKLTFLALLLVASPAVQASDCYQPVASYCAPRFVCTQLVCQRSECRYAYDNCGRRYRYEVTVSTYADVYSDGSRRTYTRTSRA